MNGPTPKQRLQASRQAIVVHLARNSRRRSHDTRPDDDTDHGSAPPQYSGPGWWRVARQAAAAWWRGHPLHSATMVARPVLEGIAREKPVQVLAVAAAVGAAVVVIKPWRLVSAGALLAATLKSTDITRLVMSMVAHAMPASPEEQTQEDPPR